MTTDTTPTTPPSSDLGSSAVQSGMSGTQSAAYLLQAYTQTVLQTPDITLPAVVDTDSNSTVVEQLPLDQATARTNATYYIQTINPAMVQTTSQVIGYGNKYISYYPTLVDLAQNLGVGDNAEQLADALNELIKKAANCEKQSVQVLNLLNDFLPLVTTDSANFQADSNYVAIALGGEEGEITNLQNQLDAYNKAMNIDLGVMAIGAGLDAVGLGCILVGILGSIESAGTTITLVVAGIGLIAGGSTAGAMAFADYEDQCKAYQKTLTELNTDKQVYAATQQASATIDGLLTSVQGGISAVGALQNSWAALQGDLNQVIGAIYSASSDDISSIIVADLTTAYNDWVVCVNLAESLQLNGLLPVQTTTVTQ